jgi:AcrR family transcriptional regulator
MVRLSETAREERAEERRSQILGAALDVFSRKGLHGATIREIASAAHLAEGTIYLYFSSKQDVFRGVIRFLAEDAVAASVVDRTQAVDDEAYLSTMLRDRIQSLARYASLIRLIAHEADLHVELRREFFSTLHHAFVARFGEYLKIRTEQGAFRPVNIDLTASICFRLMMSHVMVHHVLELDRSPHDEEQILDEMVALILYGVVRRAAPSGRASTF